MYIFHSVWFFFFLTIHCYELCSPKTFLRVKCLKLNFIKAIPFTQSVVSLVSFCGQLVADLSGQVANFWMLNLTLNYWQEKRSSIYAWGATRMKKESVKLQEMCCSRFYSQMRSYGNPRLSSMIKSMISDVQTVVTKGRDISVFA